MNLTINSMIDLIQSNVKGTTICTVKLDSDMDGKGKMRKTGNPFVGKGVVKRESLNGVIGYDYGAAVNRVAAKEGADERQAKMHPWGDMDENSLFRIHRTTGAAYLSMKVEKVKVAGFFLPDGTQVADSDIRPFIPEKTRSSTQSDLAGEVIARDYAMRNITGMKFKGETYTIVTHDIADSVDPTATETETETVPA